MLDAKVGDKDARILREDIKLVDGVYGELDIEKYRSGAIAPVFFGSAVNNFCAREMLEQFIRIAPDPQPRGTTERPVTPFEDKMSGFVLKIHANFDPKHRDRIAFTRICSGRFERNKYYHHVRLDKDIRFSNPYTFLARSKDVVDDA